MTNKVGERVTNMRVVSELCSTRVSLDVPDDRVIAVWEGPAPRPDADTRTLIRQALESPVDYPPLTSNVVPGDRVVIAFDPETPSSKPLLTEIIEILTSVGVESITVLSPTHPALLDVPAPATAIRHDPEIREDLAYLASTSIGRRVYLNRLLTDADCVIAVGRVGFDGASGHVGPWSALFPALSDDSARSPVPEALRRTPEDEESRSTARDEAEEVSWLVGCQFQVGCLSATRGLLAVFAGLNTSIRPLATAALDRAWTFRVPSKAELVIATLGSPDRPPTWSDFWVGLDAARKVAKRGGRIALLTSGEVLPDADLDDLRRRLSPVLASSRLYLHGLLDPNLAEELEIVPLDRPEQAEKLSRTSDGCILLGTADRTRVVLKSRGE